MGFQKGHTKIGGRAKGTPDRRASEVKKTMERMEFDPMAELEKLHANLDEFNKMLAGGNNYCYGKGSDYLDIVKLQQEICKTLMPYKHSRKPTEVVQHNINTDEPDLEKAREAVLKTMAKLRDNDKGRFDVV